MNKIIKKILMSPLQGVNILAGGNAVDALKQKGSPLMRRLSSKFPSVGPKVRKRLLRYGSEEDRRIYRKERIKTHVGRAVALTGGLAYLRSPKKTEYPYEY